jgi:hypothetical protein
MLHYFFIAMIILLGLIGLFTLGLVIPPRPFRSHPAASHLGDPAPMRPELPEPVRRHFFETIGEHPPAIVSAVVWGRGQASIRGVWVPLRFKSWYRAGEAFYRRMEITWFQRPVMWGSDSWIDGVGQFEMGEEVENGERVDQGQMLTLWADMVWLPSIYVHSPDIHWQPAGDHTARLAVPYRGGTESLDVHFDPFSGRMTHFSALRYAAESPEKEPWRVDLLGWKKINGLLIPYHTDMAWGEAGAPWVYWTVDGIAYNVNVADKLGAQHAARRY